MCENLQFTASGAKPEEFEGDAEERVFTQVANKNV